MADNNADYARKEYWDQRYMEEPSYDWFGSVYTACVEAAFASVERVYAEQRAAREGAAAAAARAGPEPLTVLHLGIGNSQLCEDLYTAYRERYSTPGEEPYRLVQVAVDYSPVVIERMRRQCPPDRLPDTHWLVADVRDLSAVRAAHGPCFDVVIDKATMDALQAAGGDGVSEEVARMLREVTLCLTPAEGDSSTPTRFRQFLQMTWEVPYYRLHHTTRNTDQTYAWGENVRHRFLGDSDMYRVYEYDVIPTT